MIRLLKRALRSLGLEIRRAPKTALPLVWECECDGVRFPFWIVNEHAAEWWMKPTLRMDAEMRFLREVAAPGAVVFEVGAHHGMHTVQLARWVGASGSVHAFEINAQNALALSANVGLNGLRNVHVRNVAVSANSGALSTEGERVVRGNGRVPAISLDEYCDASGIEKVDLLKIDVEGFEGQVLRGARRILSHAPSLDLELHLDDLHRYDMTPTRVLESLKWKRYEISMMVRPDWERASPFIGIENLPQAGVVNLFFQARHLAPGP